MSDSAAARPVSSAVTTPWPHRGSHATQHPDRQPALSIRERPQLRRAGGEPFQRGAHAGGSPRPARRHQARASSGPAPAASTSVRRRAATVCGCDCHSVRHQFGRVPIYSGRWSMISHTTPRPRAPIPQRPGMSVLCACLRSAARVIHYSKPPQPTSAFRACGGHCSRPSLPGIRRGWRWAGIRMLGF